MSFVRASIWMFLALAIILGNQRPAHALGGVPSGGEIVCIVFSNLNTFGIPIPHLSADGCPATPPTASGTIKVMKIVVGGSSSSSDFSIHVKSGNADVGGSPHSGTPSGTSYIGLAPGTYTISETGGQAGYATTFLGDCSSNGEITLVDGQTAVCSVINTFPSTPTPPSTPLYSADRE